MAFEGHLKHVSGRIANVLRIYLFYSFFLIRTLLDPGFYNSKKLIERDKNKNCNDPSGHSNRQKAAYW